jgi:hypothetical protein
MGAFLRGNANALVSDPFVEINPVTRVPTPIDPDHVAFTILSSDGSETPYTYGVDANVTRAGVGIYVCQLSPELPIGTYQWAVEGDGPDDYAARFEASFEIIEGAGIETPDPPPRAVMGPCSPWISGPDVAQCARVDYDGTNGYLFDSVAYNAYMALYEISGRQFPGICERLVRPCRDNDTCWLTGPISYGMGPWFWTTVPWGFGGGWAWYNEKGDKFGCAPMSKWRLAGYPVSKIVEVKIDGMILEEFDSSGFRQWRLDKWRYLVRMDTPGDPSMPNFWPSCQNMSLDDDQPGTMSVRYEWGTPVPQLGKDAAVELANQFYLACGGVAACVLPAGVQRVARQGIEVERGLLANFLDPKKPTGLVQLDTFIAAYCNGQRHGRKSALFSPDLQSFARRVGVNE